ncbi:MAG: hypothetical protein GX556_08865 [Fibrobacter sp.]|nr:hypothetical protein [Fibrobacter sp.]
MKLKAAFFLFVLISAAGCLAAPQAKAAEPDSVEEQGYRIEQPGTITFTVGVKIKGKIEKPQVMIFLPKEKTVYREIEFERSFKEDLADPLPFSPIIE